MLSKQKTFKIKMPDPTLQSQKNYKLVNGEKVIKYIMADGSIEFERGGEPLWGLGCPNRCENFWWFIAVPDLGFVFKDKRVLNIKKQFICDKCGANIKLVK